MPEPSKVIKAEAERLGFSFAGSALPLQTAHYANYLRWLQNSHAGNMRYMENERAISIRSDPSQLLEGARSVMVLTHAYPPARYTSSPVSPSGSPLGRIASYACGEDYHVFLKGKVRRLVENVERILGAAISHRIFIDSSSLMEKDLAYMAGAGWIGRNSLLLTQQNGSFQFIACILSDLELPPGAPLSSDICTACQACVVACPTQCILPDRTIDARKCISYQTIENKGIIPRELRAKMGNWVFGCDICQMVCPLNQNLLDRQTSDPTKTPGGDVDLVEQLKLRQEEFMSRYQHSAIVRATHQGFKRNLIIALANSGDQVAIPMLEQILSNDSSALLRQCAAWALGELGGRQSQQVFGKAALKEKNIDVLEEIKITLNTRSNK